MIIIIKIYKPIALLSLPFHLPDKLDSFMGFDLQGAGAVFSGSALLGPITVGLFWVQIKSGRERQGRVGFICT